MPSGGQFVAGQGAIAGSGNSLTINQSSSAGIINWQSFSIGSANSVRFNNGAGATLNRVTGGSLSRIDGNLSATGSVYLINPQGVVVGPGGKIVTNGSFVASTRDIPNSQFMAGGSMTASGSSNGDVVNAGTITSKTGDAILVGRSVTNKGTINAPKGQADLAAGNEIVLQTSGTGPHIAVSGGKGDVTNTGTIKAAQAALTSAGGNVYALVENNGGLVSATGTKTVDGHVWLTAGGTATVSGTVTAKNVEGSGGKVTVRGQDITLSGSIDASATAAKTDGGDVSVIAEDRTVFSGTIKARGGEGGTGGQVETSGDVLDVHGATVETTAPDGTTGTWLLDPYNVTISSSATSNDTLSSNIYTPSGNNSVINVSELETALGSNNIEVTTSGGGSQLGDIIVGNAISWSSGNTLTLTADNNISIYAAITAASGGLTLDAAGNISDTAAVNVGTFTLQNGNWAQNSATLPSFAATDFVISGGGFLRVTGGGGSSGSPYIVSDVYGLQGINSSTALLADDWALANNIDASGTSGWNGGAGFVPLGNSTTAFSGSFDGNGFTISNLTINLPSTDYVGLFGGSTNAIRNLGVVNASITGQNMVGGLAGRNNGTISNSYVRGTVTGDGTTGSVGGLVGNNSSGTISGSCATDTVTASSAGGGVGGLAGTNDGGTIKQAFATGDVTGGAAAVGGLVGDNTNSGQITNAYATGKVTGTDYIGGLVGNNVGVISYAYATGKVIATGVGSTNVGGLVGQNQSPGTITHSYWDTETTTITDTTKGVGNVASASGVTGETTSALSGAMPSGFSPSVWGNANNQTTPYLLNLSGPVYEGSDSTDLFWVIQNVDELQAVNTDLTRNYVLGNNIDASATSGWNSGTGFAPLGTDGAGNLLNSALGFGGIFDGLGFTVNDLTINRPSAAYIGLFGLSSGTLRNIGVIGASVAGGATTGVLVGANGGTILDTYATGTVSAGDGAGGLVGFNLAGPASGSGTISSSYASVAVRSSGQSVGGLVGENAGGTITDAYATGAVSGSDYVGGLVGYSVGSIIGSTDPTISNVYSTGAVSGSNVGGLVGATSYSITSGYWDTETSGQSSSAAGTGLTTAQLQDGSSASGLGSAFTLTSGLYPDLTNFFPHGVEVISGTAYKDAGANAAASNANGAVTVGLDSGGALVGQATTGANGYYYIALPAGTIANGSDLLVSVPTNAATGAVNAATLVASTYAGADTIQTGVNLYGSFLSEPTSATTLSGAPSLASFQSAANTVAGSDTGATTVIAAIAHPGYLTTGAGFTVDQSYTGSGFLVTTGTGDPITVSNDVTINDGGALGLLSGGALTIDAPITAEGTASVSLAYDDSDPANLNFGLTSLGFGGSLSFTNADGTTATSNQGGTLSINGDSYTLVYTMDQLDAIDATSAVDGSTITGYGPGVSGNYALASSLDASGTSYTDALVGTGDSGTGTTEFSGSFTGLGHTISNLSVAKPSTTHIGEFAGLFGYSAGTIRDIGVAGGTVSGRYEVGGLVGWNDSSGTISDAYATGVVTGDSNSADVGGLVGANKGTLTNAYAMGAVSGSHKVGGLVGRNISAITNAYATGAVSGNSSDGEVGGLVGWNGGTVTNAYATGAVTANGIYAVAGGLAGYNYGTLTNAYATGAVSGSNIVGGLVGYNDTGGTITNGYWDNQTSGLSTGIGTDNNSQTVTGLMTEDLQDYLPSGFVSSVWGTGDGLYPYFLWQYPTTPQPISGTAYSDSGVTPLASDAGGAHFVSVLADGTSLGSATTGANGYYYIVAPAGAFSNSTALLAISDGATAGARLATGADALAGDPDGDADNAEGFDIWGSTLIAPTSDTTYSSASATTLQIQDGSLITQATGSNTAAQTLVAGLSRYGYIGTDAGGLTVDQSLTLSNGLYVQTTTGDLTVASDVTLPGANGLTLASAAALTINATISVTGAGKVVTYAGYDASSSPLNGLLQFSFGPGDHFDFGTTDQGARFSSNGYDFTLIYNMGQLQAINDTSASLNSFYALATPLNAATDPTTPASWTPIGTDGAGNVLNGGDGFYGGFEGLGNTISNLTIDIGSNDYAGLFGDISGAIRNLGLIGGSVTGGRYVGGLVGYNDYGALANDYSTGTVTGSGDNIGGLVGWNEDGMIAGSYATGSVTESGSNLYESIGGLAGYSDGLIAQSYATGVVTGGPGANAGGLAGWNDGGLVWQSYATGAVSGADDGAWVGGLVGYNGGDIEQSYAMGAASAGLSNSSYVASAGGLVGENDVGATITESYSTGVASSTDPAGAVGGFIGNNDSTTPSDVATNYFDTQTSGTTLGIGTGNSASGVTGLTTSHLQGSLPSGFDSSVWGTGSGLYPYFLWQYPSAPQAVSGFAYSDTGTTLLTTGAGGVHYVSALADGTSIGSVTTGANGYYYVLLPSGTANALTYYDTTLNGSAVTANDYVQAPATGNTTADLWGGWLRLYSDAATTSAMVSGLSTALGSNAGGDFLYASGSGLVSGTSLGIVSGNTAGLAIDGALDVGSQTLSLDAAGAVTQSAALTAGSLDLLGSSASYTLDNSANAVDTLAADTGAVTFADNADLTVGTVLSTAGVTSSGAVTASTAGNLTIASGAPVTAGSGSDVVLAADGNFVNSDGRDAVAVSKGGRWLIYSAAPGSDTFGDLDSGNTAVWNATYSTLSPASVTESGNRYLFATQPMLTVTTTDATKTYGNDATSAVAAAYTISANYQAGVSGAFLGDTASSVYSGAPSVTSLGSGVSANAGSYAIDASTGTLTLLNGYALAFDNAGTLTVNARPLTITADDLSRIYGAANPSLTYTVGGDGLANGDTLSGGLSTVATAASNVGGYAITQGSLAASSNYALSYVPGTLTVNLAPLRITANDVTAASLSDAQFSASYAGFVNGQTSALVSGLQYGLFPVTASSLRYDIVPFGASAPNYAISFYEGLLTVAQPSAPILNNNGNTSLSNVTLSGRFGSFAFSNVATAAIGNAGGNGNTVLLFQLGLPGAITPFDAIALGDYSNATGSNDRLVCPSGGGHDNSASCIGASAP